MSAPSNSGLTPIHFESAPLRSRIIDAMRQAIELGTLKPGERLVEKDLCVQLNVSRTSLREALRELEGEGVVAQESARGLTVVKISQRDAQNIYRIRADLEALIFEQFLMNANDTELAEAMHLCDAMVLSYETGAFSGIVEAKRRFYDHMCNVADNRVARDLLAKLTLRTVQLRRRSVVRKERQEQSILEITALKEALSSRDVKATRSSARRHVEHAAASALPFATP